MNTLKKILFSNRLTGVLFIAFAVAMAIGTFMDAGQETSPTPLTRNLIYNAWWFEAIMLLFVINFIGNIFKYNLLNKRKWPVLVLHLSWVFILLGAFVTRYISYEGVMSIREGATESSFLSEKTYLTIYIDGDYEVDGQLMRRVEEERVDFSPRMENNFLLKTEYGGSPISIKLNEFIKGAEEDVVFDENGDYYLKIVESAGGMPHNHFLKDGSTENIHGTLYTLNNFIEGAVNISFDEKCHATFDNVDKVLKSVDKLIQFINVSIIDNKKQNLITPSINKTKNMIKEGHKTKILFINMLIPILGKINFDDLKIISEKFSPLIIKSLEDLKEF